MEVIDPFGWQNVTGEKLLDIRQQIAGFESMTWNEISVQGKYLHHSVAVCDLIPAARKRLQQLGLGDLDQLFRFRLANLERLWGYRDRNVMNVLWWDPKHEICPSKPR